MNRRSLAAALFLGPLWQSKGRFLLSLLAIALGVALGYAVQLVNQSAINEFAQAVQTLSGTADLEVRGPRSGFDETLYPRLARMSEVAVASPVLEVDVKVIGQKDSLRMLGLDVFRAAQIQPELTNGGQTDSLDTLRPDALFLSAAAADWLGVERGDKVRMQVALGEVELRVAGIVAGERTRFGWLDIAGAQASFERSGAINRIDLRLRPGVDVAAFAARLQHDLPPGVQVERPQGNVQRSATLTRAYRVNLNVLALVALFTGGLLVFSTQALAVVRRRSQLALLRVLGLTRRGLVGMLLGEALLVGVIGSAVGLVLGYFIAAVILNVVGADLGAGWFRGMRPALRLEPWAALVFFALGVAVALLGSFAPALEAAHAAPASALKAGDEQRAFERLRPLWPGVALIAVGAGATLLPPIDGLPIFGYIAIALLLIGTITLMPRVASALFERVRAPRNAALGLALAQLRGAPGQSMLSLAAIVASVSLLVSMAIMVTSFRSSLEVWLDHVLPADLYLRASGGSETAFLTPADQAQLAQVNGIRRIDFLRSQSVPLRNDRPPVLLIARSVDARDPGQLVPLVSGFIVPAADAPPPVWVSEAVAEIYGFALGSVVELPLAGRLQHFTVAGVWRDYARQQGAILMQRDLYLQLTGDRNANDVALWLTTGADASHVREAIRTRIVGGDKLELVDPGEIRAMSLRMFDRTFAVTYALELVALAIGLTGLSSSFGALVLVRRREFGMLRHVGMTRAQIGAMLAGEGLLVSALGLAVGLALGWLISLILIHVVNRQSFHWGMELQVPWGPLAIFSIVLLALASLTALIAGRKAVSGDAARAVREDW